MTIATLLTEWLWPLPEWVLGGVWGSQLTCRSVADSAWVVSAKSVAG
ncbi:MAG: hypothetical protein AAGE92_04685 [Cyanobacteria bacterium P01_G01_bin.4]